MKNNHRLAILLLSFAFVTSLSSCSLMKGYGRLRAPWFGAVRPGISALMDTFDEHRVYYAGISVQTPSAVLFDPRQDDLTLQPHKWIRLTRLEDLQEAVTWLEADIRHPPRLYQVLGPGGRVFGYFYSPWNSVLLKVVDDHTLWVEDLPLPPVEYGGNEGKISP